LDCFGDNFLWLLLNSILFFGSACGLLRCYVYSHGARMIFECSVDAWVGFIGSFLSTLAWVGCASAPGLGGNALCGRGAALWVGRGAVFPNSEFRGPEFRAIFRTIFLAGCCETLGTPLFQWAPMSVACFRFQPYVSFECTLGSLNRL
jgi:hypothetical protein